MISIRGIYLRKAYTKKEIIEEALDYEPHDGDVILASYPRTGTMFLSYIVQQILTKGESFPDSYDIQYKVIPFSFIVGKAGLDAIQTNPRVYKHHFALDKVKHNPKSKIIYIYRRPEDNVVSRYNYYKDYGAADDFDDFFEKYLEGEISFGPYFDHILSYWKLKGSENVLFVSYENLVLNKKEEILRIAKFIDEKFFNALITDESIMNKIIRNTDFEYMKKNLTFIPIGEDKKVNHFRKGILGDGKNTLSEDQYQRLRDLAKEKLQGTELITEWYTKEKINSSS